VSITEKVRKYLEISGTVEAMDVSITEALRQRIVGVPNDVSEKMNRIFTEKFGPPVTLDIMATVFEEYYSEEELDACIAFYDSPIGRSVASKSNLIMRKTSPMITAAGRKALEAVMREFLKDLTEGFSGSDDEPNPWRTP